MPSQKSRRSIERAGPHLRCCGDGDRALAVKENRELIVNAASLDLIDTFLWEKTHDDRADRFKAYLQTRLPSPSPANRGSGLPSVIELTQKRTAICLRPRIWVVDRRRRCRYWSPRDLAPGEWRQRAEDDRTSSPPGRERVIRVRIGVARAMRNIIGTTWVRYSTRRFRAMTDRATKSRRGRRDSPFAPIPRARPVGADAHPDRYVQRSTAR